jgi:hypothetical protein
LKDNEKLGLLNRQGISDFFHHGARRRRRMNQEQEATSISSRTVINIDNDIPFPGLPSLPPFSSSSSSSSSDLSSSAETTPSERAKSDAPPAKRGGRKNKRLIDNLS